MSDRIEVKNAKITGTTLGVESHGILSSYVYLDYGGGSQGFGGWFLDMHDEETGGRKFAGHCGMFVRRTCEAVGVDNWEDLKGQTCRVRAEWDKVHAIGHIIEDKWFCPEEEFQVFKAKEPTA